MQIIVFFMKMLYMIIIMADCGSQKGRCGKEVFQQSCAAGSLAVLLFEKLLEGECYDNLRNFRKKIHRNNSRKGQYVYSF